LDRLVAAIIVLGLFAGSVQSILLYGLRCRGTTEAVEDRTLILAGEKGAFEQEGGFERVQAPIADEARGALKDLGESALVTKLGGEGEAQGYEVVGMNGGVDALVSADGGGIATTYPDRRVVYVGYVLVLLRLGPGVSPVGIHDLLAACRGVAVDEMGQSMSILVPAWMDDRLAALVENGTLLSYETGGWGSGIGRS